MSKGRIAHNCICCDGINLNKSSAVLMPFVAKRVFDHEPVMITQEWGMRDLQIGMAYSLCNSIQCADCGVLFLDLRFSDAEMANLYANYRDDEYTRLRAYYEPGYKEMSDYLFSQRSDYILKIEEYLELFVPSTPSVLDWGGDTGINTPLRDRARLIHIYDISNKSTVTGTQSVDLATVKQLKYDLIVCSQVLEHVSYPQDLICDIVSVMDSDTLLYLEVPHEELMQSSPRSKDLYNLKRHWHEHINFFSEDSIRLLVKHCGLTLKGLKYINISYGLKKTGCVISILCQRS